MEYRGYKVKEITTIGAFDVPRKMLVWGELGKSKDGAPKVHTVSARVRLDAGVFALTTDGAFFEHCADIPLEAQLEDANSEIAKLKKALDEVHSGKVIIYRHHDRHTEDHVEIYPYSEENFEKLKRKCQGDWGMNSDYSSKAPGKVGHWSDDLSDYEWGWESSYWSSLTVKSILDISEATNEHRK